MFLAENQTTKSTKKKLKFNQRHDVKQWFQYDLALWKPHPLAPQLALQYD
jgi:hypothetical protein